MSKHTTPRIAIIGGGPGGLTLARILQTRGIAATVFEQEHSPEERPQGGSLDLHPKAGQYAVSLAGLTEQFRALARYEDQGTRLLDKTGAVLFEEGEDDRPEIDRTELRAMLLTLARPTGRSNWGHRLHSIRLLGDGVHELVFADGRAATFDLVVGADGAWSRVRPLLSDAVPSYTGVTIVEMSYRYRGAAPPDIAALVGHGSMAARSDGKGLTAQRNSHGQICIYATLRVGEGWAASSGIDFAQPDAARAGLISLFPDWDAGLLGLIRSCDDHFAGQAAVYASDRPHLELPRGSDTAGRRGPPDVAIRGPGRQSMPCWMPRSWPVAHQRVRQRLKRPYAATEQAMFVRARRCG